MFTLSLMSKFKALIFVCVLLLVVQLVNFITAYHLTQYGIHPRQISSVWTILTAPFIHGSFIHLINNVIGLCIFSVLYFVHTMDRYIKSLILIILISGALVWLFGRNAFHIGASGVVFGLWSLCIATAWFERKFINIVIAAVVIIFYGGVIYGVLPISSGVSFESHIFGVIAGIFCAYFHSLSKK